MYINIIINYIYIYIYIVNNSRHGMSRPRKSVAPDAFGVRSKMS